MTTAKTKLLTADDLMGLSAKGFRGELIRGVLHEEMPVGIPHAIVVATLTAMLLGFIRPRRLGTLLAGEPGIWLERAPDTVRAPDIAYISTERMPLGDAEAGYSEIVPDLAVEVVSPRDTRPSIRRKSLMWLENGVRLVWAVHPDSRTIDVYRKDAPAITLTEADTLDGGDVLSGFACRVSEILDQ